MQHAFTATFDVFDRRIGITADGVQTWTVYDGQNAWTDFNSSGAVSARYLFGERTDELLARWRPADGLAWALADKQGSIREWIDGGGAVVASRTFDAFGRILASSGAVDRFAYQGREWESSVGSFHATGPAGPDGRGYESLQIRVQHPDDVS